MSMLLRGYLAFSTVSGPIWRIAHKRRLKRGKELPERLPEKYGIYSEPRPEGTVLWFHALSVGESLALVPLIEQALKDIPQAHVVLTTSTATSIAALDKAGLPKQCKHILLPIDTVAATRAFLNHWRPDLAAFAELDFWPRLMVETNRRAIPMALINSRMPDANFARRKKLGAMMAEVLRMFDQLLVQDEVSADRFAELGAEPGNITVVGALKAAARPLPADETELARIQTVTTGRPTWLAAATVAAEHPAMFDAHAALCNDLPNALLILAPRFPADGDAAETAAQQQFEHVGRRSLGEELTSATQVYIADTIGEMGLWYRVAPISFVGHSLDPALDGKNPFEAAALGSAILHGPGISYFSESYDGLKADGATRLVRDAASLAEAVRDLQDPAKRHAMIVGAAQTVAKRRGVLDTTWTKLQLLLLEKTPG